MNQLSRDPLLDERRVPRPAALYGELTALREDVLREAAEQLQEWAPMVRRRSFQPSAENLAAYLALRRRDLRSLQLVLMTLGLSSLGRCESRVRESLDAVIGATEMLAGAHAPDGYPPSVERFFSGSQLLARSTEAVFGPTPDNRAVRVMVTVDSKLGRDADAIERLIRSGMDVVRINSAHGDPDDWRRTATTVRAAAERAACPCRVELDLTGPRARISDVSEEVRVHEGDQFVLVADRRAWPQGGTAVTCSMPELVSQLAPGVVVWIDEGKLGATVVEQRSGSATVRVTRAPEKGFRLRADKALNAPGIELPVDSLTAKDLEDLRAAVGFVDLLGYSFVRRRRDLCRLQDELRELGKPMLPLIVKVETRSAVEHLPELIVQGAGIQPLAVMIARGDLAVEIGYTRLAEIQEELLWVCEAAHVPVVWATQVLDAFVHTGTHARGELTDAAMAERAECVMLNKGPYVVEAVRLLSDVLARMEGHQVKKTSRLRALASW